MADNCSDNCECKGGREPTSFTDPPFEPECPACDGVGVVEVAQVYRNDAGPYAAFWPEKLTPAPEIPCPWCDEA